MNAKDIATTYVRFMTEGSEADAWAAEELTELARDHPERAWDEIRRINSLPISNDAFRETIYATLGCGPLEDLLVFHEETMLPVVVKAAEEDAVVRRELDSIYESSVSRSVWAAIQVVLAQSRRA